MSKTISKKLEIIISYLFILLMFGGIYVTEVSAINHDLLNPGFESWTGSPDNWDVSSGINYAQESTIVSSGSSSLEVSGTTGENIWQNRTFTANPTMSYQFSCQVYDDVSGGIKLRLFVNGSSAAQNMTEFSTESVNQASWQKLSVMITPDFTPQYYLAEIQISTSLNGPKKNYVDDCSISEVPKPDVTAPSISSPGNKTYVKGSNPNLISWTISDAEPQNYTLYQNGTNVKAGNWNSGSTIKYLITGLDLGIYNFTLIASDLSNNTSIDTIYVTLVQDTTAPTIIGPIDSTIIVNTSSNPISWEVADSNPYNFTIFKNNLNIATGNWVSGTPITQSIDGLSVGEYNFTLLVQDEFNLFSSDQVIVTVIEDVTPSADPTLTDPTSSTDPTSLTDPTSSTVPTTLSSNEEESAVNLILIIGSIFLIGTIDRYFGKKR